MASKYVGSRFFLLHSSSKGKQVKMRSLHPPKINLLSNKPFKGFLNIYLFLTLGLLSYYLFSWPLEARDTDLWYHLSGGRFFFSQRVIPHTTFYSYLTPTREYVDYYWLFQVIVYAVFSLGNYYGLIILKAVVYLALISMIFRFIFSNQSEKEGCFYPTLIFTLFVLLFLFRFPEIRPYIFGYLFILIFLFHFDETKKNLYFMPLISVLWCNIHGIAYPIILVITFSYIIEFIIEIYRKKSTLQSRHLRYLVPSLLAIVAVYATPHSVNLLSIPLVSTRITSEYINELRPLNIEDFFFFDLSSSGLFWQSIFNLIVILTIISLFLSIRRGRLRISHFLLIIGGIILLSKGVRFYFEFALLSLPLLRSNPLIIHVSDHGKVRIFRFVSLTIILVSPVFALASYYDNRPHYPFSTTRVPEGIIEFLNKIPAQGKIASAPNIGGYLQWKLYPKYRITMDLQVPFVFKDEDLHSAALSFSNADVFSNHIVQHEPDFIMPYLLNKYMKHILKNYPQYKLVFFDHIMALYVNEKSYPEIARKYEITKIDPFELSDIDIDKFLVGKDRQDLIKEIDKILIIYPKSFLGNQLMAMICLNDNESEKALFHAESIIKNFPEKETGYLLKGNALNRLKRYESAIINYTLALDRTEESKKSSILVDLGYTHYAKNDFKKAYSYLIKGVPIFSSKTTFHELYNLGSLALKLGKIDEAYAFLQFASQKVPAFDKESKRRIDEQLSRFGKI